MKLIDRIDAAATLDLRRAALPHHLKGLFGGVQPMVSPSWKHLFRIGHAQHVRPALPPSSFPPWARFSFTPHRVVMQHILIGCCVYFVSHDLHPCDCITAAH